jgi:hypothetical protein
MMARVIGLERIEVPISASALRAIVTISASLLPCGLCQEALPWTISQPAAANLSSVLPTLPGCSGANTKIFGLGMNAHPLSSMAESR